MLTPNRLLAISLQLNDHTVRGVGGRQYGTSNFWPASTEPFPEHTVAVRPLPEKMKKAPNKHARDCVWKSAAAADDTRAFVEVTTSGTGYEHPEQFNSLRFP
jgi:hypothetical protein